MGESGAIRRIDENRALRAVVAGTASETGESFYRALVWNLAQSLDTHGAWVTAYDESSERLRALAFCFGGEWLDAYEYPIAGTACEIAIREKRLLHIPDKMLDLYPQDKDPRMQGVVSYLGVPILSEDERVLGHLAVVDVRPMPDDVLLLALFRLFANRAAAEMQRLRLSGELRERQEKLERLIDSAMDAIVELDRDLNVTMMNAAAEKLFATSSDSSRGRRVDHLLGAAATRKLGMLADELDRRTGGERHLWIPAGLQARAPGGRAFPAEATLSRYEMKGQAFFTLILRNVDERVEAERRIRALSAHAEYLREEIEADHGFREIVGRSPALRLALHRVSQVAGTDATVLVVGETGTGKELFARAIHGASERRNKPLIKVNCAAIPATLIESEFFGHERGAFTGATQRRDGRFALADGGTMFLDEVGEIPLELQGKLLRVLQEGEFEPVGASRTRKVNVRLIAATNRDLEQAVRRGEFREDLYYRLSVFPLRLPPLRERGDDIALLAEAIVAQLARRMGRTVEPLSAADLAALRSYAWPGNVRELRNVLERALITCTDGRLHLERVLPDVAPADHPAGAALPGHGEVLTARRLEQLERDNMIAALARTGWRVGGQDGAARLLGVPPTTFKSRMQALRIERPGAR